MKTKIKTIEAKFWQSKPNGFKVVLEDGTEGNLSEKDSDKDLKNGDEVEVTISDYISKAGKHSNLFAIKHSVSETPQKEVKTETKLNKVVVNTPLNIQLKANASIKAMEFMVNAFIADKIQYDQIEKYYKELKGYLFDAIDECSKE